MTNLWTLCHTALFGKFAGADSFGNRYYQGRRHMAGGRYRRWVVYRGEVEASRVPPVWHAWLHYTTDDAPAGGDAPHPPWGREHIPNRTGTDGAYRPPGHIQAGGKRDRATGDYEPWTPR